MFFISKDNKGPGTDFCASPTPYSNEFFSPSHLMLCWNFVYSKGKEKLDKFNVKCRFLCAHLAIYIMTIKYVGFDHKPAEVFPSSRVVCV